MTDFLSAAADYGFHARQLCILVRMEGKSKSWSANIDTLTGVLQERLVMYLHMYSSKQYIQAKIY